MKKLAKRITGKEWGMILITVLFTCCSVYLELEVPTYVSKITELLGTPGTELGDLWSPATKMMGLVILSLPIICNSWIFCRSSCSILYDSPTKRYF